jgi:hypothetical protein
MSDILGALQYSPEMHICTLKMSIQWILFVYMGAAIGIPFFGIIAIYLYIVRQTRRINVMTVAVTTSVSASTRDLFVLKRILTLIGILGAAGLPSLILVIWNVFSRDGAPVPLYLFCALTISFCVNIQISLIFITSKKIRVVFWNRIRHMCMS